MEELAGKVEKKIGACIVNRDSTIRYECNKAYIETIEQFKIKEQWFLDFKKKGICIYCNNRSVKKSSTGDHLLPVVSNNGKKNIVTNFSNLTVPCCSECNSKKGNKNWRDFIEQNNYIENKEILENIQNIIDINIEYYEIDQEFLETSDNITSEYLQKLRTHVQNVRNHMKKLEK
jgi:hypothetical protein